MCRIVQRKTGIGYRQPAIEEHLFVGGLDREHLVGKSRTVDIGVRNLAAQAAAADHLAGITIQVLGVGLEMDPASGREELRITVQEKRGCKAFLGPAGLELRIGEGDPQFGDFARCKKGVDDRV